jgi:hypothetical protein
VIRDEYGRIEEFLGELHEAERVFSSNFEVFFEIKVKPRIKSNSSSERTQSKNRSVPSPPLTFDFSIFCRSTFLIGFKMRLTVDVAMGEGKKVCKCENFRFNCLENGSVI